MPVNAVERCPCSCGAVERDPKTITIGELADAVKDIFYEADNRHDFKTAFFRSKDAEAQKTIMAVCRLDPGFAEVCDNIYRRLQIKYT